MGHDSALSTGAKLIATGPSHGPHGFVARRGGEAYNQATPADDNAFHDRIADVVSGTTRLAGTAEDPDGCARRISNAGIETRTPLLDTREAGFDMVLAVNLKGAFFGAQFAAQRFVAQRSGGLILTISSTHEGSPMPGNIAYRVSEGGAKMLTRTAGVELGSLGIRFVNIAPGAVNTPINAIIEMDPDLLKRLEEAIPPGRIAQPAEIAGIVVFLASGRAGYVNATTVTVDGGLSQWSVRL